MDAENRNRGYRYIIQRIGLILIGTAILFSAAGTIHWLQVWICTLFILLLEACMLIILTKKAPEMLNQRGSNSPIRIGRLRGLHSKDSL
jgi:hypothetical protein